MAKPLVPDDLWSAVEPQLPRERAKPKGGRPRLPDRAALTGILFVLTTGTPWEHLPSEMGCGSGMTLLAARLRDWQAAGVWGRLHRLLLNRLEAAGRIRWDRAALDSTSVSAKRGARRPAPTRRTAAGRDEAPPRHRRRGHAARPDHQPRQPARQQDAGGHARRRSRDQRGKARQATTATGKLHADKAYTGRPIRRALRRRGIIPRIARKGIEDSRRLGRHRWVVERTFAWMARFRRLVVRYERRADIHLAFTTLDAALITLNQVRRFC